MITKQHIQITAHLYECQETAKRFFGEEYSQKIEPYSVMIKQVMKANACNALQALLKISKTEHYNDSGMVQMLYMAAVVEELEKDSPKQTDPNNLTMAQAEMALRCGKTISHKNMMPGEWVRLASPGIIQTEDGNEVSTRIYWADRTNESWKTGWRIVK